MIGSHLLYPYRIVSVVRFSVTQAERGVGTSEVGDNQVGDDGACRPHEELDLCLCGAVSRFSRMSTFSEGSWADCFVDRPSVGVARQWFGSRLPVGELAVVLPCLSILERCGQPYKKNATNEHKFLLLESGTEHLGSSTLPSPSPIRSPWWLPFGITAWHSIQQAALHSAGRTRRLRSPQGVFVR